MKKIVLAMVLVLAVFAGQSQSFEGVIKWNLKLDITDPKMKAQMEEAKKKANDPATQAQMKEMQAKMNDPQFKSLMDSNPQMKAQVEAMIKMMSGGDLNSLMPSAVLIKLKGQNSLTSIEGGIMDKTDVLYLADKKATYTISHPAKTYSLVPEGKNDAPSTNSAPKVTKTSETAKIMGYNCTKYLIETTMADGKKLNTNYWATTEIKDIDLKALAKQQKQMGRGSQQIFYDTVDGFPMKIEAVIPQGNMVMEVVDFKKGGVNASEFALPAGYKETKM